MDVVRASCSWSSLICASWELQLLDISGSGVWAERERGDWIRVAEQELVAGTELEASWLLLFELSNRIELCCRRSSAIDSIDSTCLCDCVLDCCLDLISISLRNKLSQNSDLLYLNKSSVG